MDDIDRAQDHEQRDRDAALAAQRQRIDDSHAPPRPARDCIDCHGPIEPARWDALRGCTSRCAGCAADYERRRA